MLELFGDPRVDSRKVGLLSEKDGKNGSVPFIRSCVYIICFLYDHCIFIYVYCVYKDIFV